MKKTKKWATFSIEDKKKIVLLESGEKTDTWDDFVKKLPEDQPRYALVDIDYTTDDGRPQSKLTFVMWSPDDKCGVKDKMLYASSKDAIKKKFSGITKEIQANDCDDLTADNVNALMNRK